MVARVISVLLLSLVCCMHIAKAQEKTVLQDSLRIKYFISATGLIQSGNVDRTLFPTLSNIAFSKNKFEVRQTLNYSYGTIGTPAGKRKIEDELLVRTEPALFQRNRIFPFAWGLYEKSKLRNITQRWLGGAGIGLNIFSTKDHTLSLRNGIAIETTHFTINASRNVWRYSGRLAGTHKLFSNKIVVNHETYIQPAMNSSGDFRYRTIWRINVPIWKHIALTTLLDEGYESEVDVGKKKNNFFMSYGLSIAN